MGAWSTGIFDNDTASDVRDDWLEGIGNNEPVNELTSRLLEEYEESLTGADGDPEFWMGLAAIQSKTGYLDKAVRDKTLALIRSGKAVEQWVEEDSKLAPKRQKALDALAEKLTGPQPRPKRRGKQGKQLGTPFDIGDVILVHGHKKTRALVVVIDQCIYPRKAQVDPVIQILLWDGKKIPATAREVRALPTLYGDPCAYDDVAELASKPLKPRHNMYLIQTVKAQDVFTDEMGKVVLKGVKYPPAGDWVNGTVFGGEVVTTSMSWPHLLEYIGSSSYTKDRQITIKKSGTLAARLRRLIQLK